MVDKYLLEDIIDKNTGEVIAETGLLITDVKLKEYKKAGIAELTVAKNEESLEVQMLKNTMEKFQKLLRNSKNFQV